MLKIRLSLLRLLIRIAFPQFRHNSMGSGSPPQLSCPPTMSWLFWKRTTRPPILIKTLLLAFLMFILETAPLKAQDSSLFGKRSGFYPSNKALKQAVPRFASYSGTLSSPSLNTNSDFLPALSYIKAGTILNGVLEEDLSSKTSKAGQTFALRLEDGYSVNGKQVIPRQSLIIGTVIAATSAKTMRNYMPGEVQISLQTLVFPDGRYTKFFGFIDHNPAQDLKTDRYKKTFKEDLVNYASLLKSSAGSYFGSISAHAGLPLGKMLGHYRGPEFKIQKGELLAVKANRSIDLSLMKQLPLSPEATAENGAIYGPSPESAQSHSSIEAKANMAGDLMPLPLAADSKTEANSIFDTMLERPQADFRDPF